MIIGNGKEKMSALRYYQRGVIMNVSNPKVGLFFLAFLPQFTNTNDNDVAIQLIVLGLCFIAATMLVFGSIALMADRVTGWIDQSNKTQLIIHRVVAVVFVGLSISLAMVNIDQIYY
jgi:threonine/homoserine/homoserine lactone efflux protein